MTQSSEYQKNYYLKYRERMNAKSLECYYARKERESKDPKQEFNKIISLFTKAHASHDSLQT